MKQKGEKGACMGNVALQYSMHHKKNSALWASTATFASLPSFPASKKRESIMCWVFFSLRLTLHPIPSQLHAIYGGGEGA